MNKIMVIMVIGVMSLSMVGCGGKATADPAIQTTVTEQAVTDTEGTGVESETEVAKKNEAMDKLEAMNPADITAYMQKVQQAFADKNMDALSDLVAYPAYVGVGDGTIVNSKEELVTIGADQIFTDEMCQAVAAADISDFTPSMAGITMGDSASCLTFKLVDGALGITGINY